MRYLPLIPTSGVNGPYMYTNSVISGILLYPPNNEVVGGYIGFTPSVRPSVRTYVPPAVSAL